MHYNFYKYQGTGNDFIIIDNRNMQFDRSNRELVKKLCDRRFGIGADGLMLLQDKPDFSFEMIYYNSDGNESSMCGNGGRCMTAFAKDLGLVDQEVVFLATDGIHEALIGGILESSVTVKLKMNDVKGVEDNGDYVFLDTGSPHYVEFVKDVEKLDVYNKGREIRYNSRFREKGTNVNFVEIRELDIFVRTYERGVEGETYSCGTGVTAAALAAFVKNKITEKYCRVKTLGGELAVYFEPAGEGFVNVWLEGPATFVFKGEIDV